MTEKKLIFFTPEKKETPGQWLVDQEISAGFPSPADDFKEIRISLDRELVKNEEATFYAKVSGDSMIKASIEDGDISESKTGSFTVNSNTATATFNVTEDNTVESPQTFLLTLNNLNAGNTWSPNKNSFLNL